MSFSIINLSSLAVLNESYSQTKTISGISLKLSFQLSQSILFSQNHRITE